MITCAAAEAARAQALTSEQFCADVRRMIEARGWAAEIDAEAERLVAGYLADREGVNIR